MTDQVPENLLYKEYRKVLDALPACLSTCDGDLPGEAHEDNCPAKDQPKVTRYDIFCAGYEAGRRAENEEIQDEVNEDSFGGWI